MATLSQPDRRAPLLTTDEVAAILRVSPRTVRRLGQAGQLERVRVGRLARYAPASLDALLAPHNDVEDPGKVLDAEESDGTAPQSSG